MTELPDFLLARIAEDEQVAREARPDEYLTTRDRSPLTVGQEAATWYATVAIRSGRVLAECEAKRRIVEQHLENESSARAYRSPRWADAMNDEDRLNWRKAEARLGTTDGVLRLLALPYGDHPDYRQEWKP